MSTSWWWFWFSSEYIYIMHDVCKYPRVCVCSGIDSTASNAGTHTHTGLEKYNIKFIRKKSAGQKRAYDSIQFRTNKPFALTKPRKGDSMAKNQYEIAL